MKMMNMQATALSCKVKASLGAQALRLKLLNKFIILIASVWLSGCAARSAPAVRTITLQQQWALNPGDDIVGNEVAGSLGDISLFKALTR